MQRPEQECSGPLRLETIPVPPISVMLCQGRSAVTTEVERRRAELEALCRRYGVHRLELFGSAATGQHRPGESDLDFLVEFHAVAPGGYADAYFGLLESLEELFGGKIDLVVPSAVR